MILAALGWWKTSPGQNDHHNRLPERQFVPGRIMSWDDLSPDEMSPDLKFNCWYCQHVCSQSETSICVINYDPVNPPKRLLAQGHFSCTPHGQWPYKLWQLENKPHKLKDVWVLKISIWHSQKVLFSMAALNMQYKQEIQMFVFQYKGEIKTFVFWSILECWIIIDVS